MEQFAITEDMLCRVYKKKPVVVELTPEEIKAKDAEFERRVMERLRVYRGEIRYMGDR